MTMTKEKATALRRPFPPESVGQLPKGGQMLDFVGHAAVTDRLLAVDPEWSWEPFAIGPDGLPAVAGGNFWIRLTVCGVTRIGVGDGKSLKEAIGDAIRNAAMRFGVALDLWAKENLVEFAQSATGPAIPDATPEPSREQDDDDLLDQLERKATATPAARARRAMFAEFGRHKIPEANQLAGINSLLGTSYTSRGDVSEEHAKAVAADLKKRPVGALPQTADSGAS